MSTPITLDDLSVACWSAPYLLADGPQSWVEIVRSGRFFSSTGGREVTLTEDDILSMASTYAQVQAEGWFCADGAPVGYNHASAHGQLDPESTKAAARVSRVEVRTNAHGGVSLWGLFSWTDEGSSRVDAGEFASISAELVPPGAATSKTTGQPMGGWCLVGATLTNSPFIPGMQSPQVSGTLATSESKQCRIFLSEAPATEKPQMSDNLVKLAEVCGLPAEAPELLAEVQRLQADAAKLVVLTETLETATVELEGLRARNVILEDRESSRVLDEACSVGRIAPTEREQYLKVLGTLGEEDTHRLFVEGRIPVTREATDAPEATTDDDLGASDSFVALMDKAVADGKTEQEAWHIAASQAGTTLYTDEAN